MSGNDHCGAIALFVACVCLTGLAARMRAEDRPSLASKGVHVEGAILKTIESTTLSARVSGVIERLEISEGHTVTAGQVLGKLDDEAIRLKLAQLRTQLDVAKRKLANDIDERLAMKSQQVAENEYQRALSANELVSNTYPINEIDRLRLVAERSRLEVERAAYGRELAALDVTLAEHEFRQADELQRRHIIVAPAPGVIVSVEKRAGEWIEPGAEILRIVRIDRLRVEGFIPAALAASDLVGRTAKIQTIDADEALHHVTGKVVFVSPDVNPVNAQVRVFIEIDNSQARLRPGSRVAATIDAS